MDGYLAIFHGTGTETGTGTGTAGSGFGSGYPLKKNILQNLVTKTNKLSVINGLLFIYVRNVYVFGYSKILILEIQYDVIVFLYIYLYVWGCNMLIWT